MAACTLFKCPVIFLILFASALLHIGQTEEPTFTQCRVHIEAAIKGIATDGSEQESPILQDDQPAHVEEQSVEPVSEPPPLEEEHYEEPTQPEVTEEHVPEANEEENQDEGQEDEPEQLEEEEASGDEQDDGDEEEVEAPQEEAPQEEEIPQEEESHPVEEVVEEAPVEPESEPAELPQEEVIEEPVPEELPEAAALVEEEAAPVEEPVVEEPIPEPTPEQEPEPIVAEEPAAVEEPVAVEEPITAVEEPVAAPEPEPVVEVVQEAEPAPVEEAAPVIVDDPAEGIIEEAPEERRSRDHISRVLRLGQDAETDMMRESIVLNVLKDVKKLVENSVRSLETIFKYNDVSNRNFGDPEIFSKPLVLFLGPWSGGKSSIINYLLGTEFTQNALKTGAEPSATFFQILMYGEVEEMLDGTQLAADWTFSGLQKFGQAFIDRLRGKRLPNKILEKCNIVEVPGILEVRKQVDRPYPFNDVVQWFIDRADIIFVVYDPTKLDTGLEHEALFDQLKGRQNQVRVLLNKADSVTQEELLLIQNNLVWNLSPLMASPLPPTLYAGSFWSKPYKPDAPVRLLRSHEENMLQDLRDTLDNVVENTIAEARRHAVRVRNHAKMVDCYLTTFFNQKGFFGNKKATADDIIENPHAYHIFEGLSTLSNISRYDLPDAEVYKDFFRLHALYDFKPLASTCTFFRGCPLDKLDTAIAYELPELVGKYKKRLQSIAAKKTGR